DVGRAVAADSTGNLYVAGSEDVAGQMSDIILLKYDPSGTILWTRTKNGLANDIDIGTGVAVDGNDNPVVAGTTTPSAGQHNSFVRKFDPTGSTVCPECWQAIGDMDDAEAVAIGSAGNIVITGWDYVAGPTTDMTVVKLSGTTGNQMWKQTYVG